MVRLILKTLLLALVVSSGGSAYAVHPKRHGKSKPPVRKEVAVVKDTDGVAEARLIEVYKLIAQAHNREARFAG